MQTFLSNGLQFVRDHLDTVIPEVFENFKASHVNTQYGDAEIANVKKWFATNAIPVRMAFSLIPDRFPQITINLAAASEAVQHASLNDYAETLLEAAPAQVVVNGFVPNSYDSETG